MTSSSQGAGRKGSLSFQIANAKGNPERPPSQGEERRRGPQFPCPRPTHTSPPLSTLAGRRTREGKPTLLLHAKLLPTSGSGHRVPGEPQGSPMQAPPLQEWNLCKGTPASAWRGQEPPHPSATAGARAGPAGAAKLRDRAWPPSPTLDSHPAPVPGLRKGDSPRRAVSAQVTRLRLGSPHPACKQEQQGNSSTEQTHFSS